MASFMWLCNAVFVLGAAEATDLMRKGGRRARVEVDSTGSTVAEVAGCKACILNLGTVQDSTKASLKDGLRFIDVCTVGTMKLDIEAKAVTQYEKLEGAENRGIEQMYKISLKPGTNVSIQFRIVKSGTSELYTVDETIFTVVIATDYNHYAKGSLVSEHNYTFELDGAEVVLSDLAPEARERMVSRKYRGLSSWTAFLNAKEATDNPHFLIGGMTDVMNFTPGCLPTSAPGPAPEPAPTPAPQQDNSSLDDEKCKSGTYEVMRDARAVASYGNKNLMVLAHNGTSYYIGRTSYSLGSYQAPTKQLFAVMQGVETIAAGDKDSLYLAQNRSLYNRTLNKIMSDVQNMYQGWDRHVVLLNNTAGVQWNAQNCPPGTSPWVPYMTQARDAIFSHGYPDKGEFVHIAAVLLNNGTVVEVELVRCKEIVRSTTIVNVPKARAITSSDGGYYMVLTEDGDVYTIGTQPGKIKSFPADRTPKKLQVPKAASMAAGKSHLLVLARNGTVYIAGSYERKSSSGVFVETAQNLTPIMEDGKAIAPGPLVLHRSGIVCSMTPFEDMQDY